MTTRRRKSEVRVMTRLVAFRATPDEQARIYLAAERAGLSVSAYVRRCVERAS